MYCPDCWGKLRVVDTREQENGDIKRRRLCLECGRRYTTIEPIPKLEDADDAETERERP